MVGPVPLAAFGVAFYLTILFLALYLYTSDALDRRLILGFFGLSIAGFVMSVIFELMQAFLIHAFCQYCALQALCATAIFFVALVLFRATKRAPDLLS